MPVARDQVVPGLEKLVHRLLVQAHQANELECRIFPPLVHGNPFIIELGRDRFVRRVSVDLLTVQRLEKGHADAALVRELKTAILTVARLAGQRK